MNNKLIDDFGACQGSALKNVIDLTEEELSSLQSLATLCQQSGKTDEAIQIISLLIAIDPYQPKWWRNMAKIQQRAGQHILAFLAFEMLSIFEERNEFDLQLEMHS